MSNATEPAQAHSRIIPASKRWQVRVVVVVAVLLLVGGMLGAVLASQSVVRHDREKSKQALALSSSEVASTLRLAIQREQDLAVSATGFFLGKPYPTNTEFLAWA
ncbi:MAG: hypothetical protein ACXVJ3_21250, partial [Ilumatobacteraceae bacterium]